MPAPDAPAESPPASPHLPGAARLPAVEAALVLVALLYAFVVHWQGIRSYHWNSDEPQHLHVVWSWTQGLLPYRDTFDNHTPLFSWLCSPLLRALGERPDIVEPMRRAMLPLFALSLWFVYRIGASLFSPRVGAWAAVLASLWPGWTEKMVEFRTDVLWTTLWLAIVAVLVGGRFTPRRALCAGLLLGAAFCTSMKTVLLLLTLLAAAVAVLLFRYRTATKEDPFPTAGEICRVTAAFLGGMLLLPAAWLCFFAGKGALGPLYYCIITHNVVPKVETVGRHFIRASWIVGLLAAVWLIPPAFVRWLIPDRRRQATALFVFVLAISFHPLVRGFWTKVTAQDYLPYWPIPAVVVAFAGAGLLPRLLAAKAIPFPVPTLLMAALAGWFATFLDPRDLRAVNRPRIDDLAKLLTLVRPGEYVMDAKGDSIFRQRPYYYVIETFTRQRLQNGSLPEALPARLAETHTAVLFGNMLLPQSTRDFLAANYLPVTPARPPGEAGPADKPFEVAGKLLTFAADGRTASFDVTIPQSYRVIAERPGLEGTIDGLPLTEAHWLAAGPHRIDLTHSAGRAALLWARAVEQGYTAD